MTLISDIARVAMPGFFALLAPLQNGDAPKHRPVCAEGVRIYDRASDVPVPHDSVKVPPAPGPVIVTNDEEAAAAELALRGRVGSAGGTGVIVSVETQDDGAGRITQRRTVQGVFVPSDSVRAYAACIKR